MGDSTLHPVDPPEAATVSAPAAAVHGRSYWTLLRIPVAILAVGVPNGLVRFALRPIAGTGSFLRTEMPLVASAVMNVATVATVYVAYRAYVRWVERRDASELGTAGLARELGLGVLLGAALFAATIGVLAVLGSYRVDGWNPWLGAVPALLASAAAAFSEEVLARGILFRILEERLGIWVALIGSSALFGLAHAANPGSTVISATAVGVEAGILLGVAFAVTRRLWLPVGIHFAWNFTQGGIFGVAVSGVQMRGLLRGRLTGPRALSGGPFGAEASPVAVLLCLVAAGFLFFHYVKRNGPHSADSAQRGSDVDLPADATTTPTAPAGAAPAPSAAPPDAPSTP